MKTEFQVIEEGTETELFKTTDAKTAKNEFGNSGEYPCRRVGHKINVNDLERTISDIYFCMDYDYNGLTKITITVEQI